MIVGIDFGTCYSSVAIMNGLKPVTTCVKDTTGMGVPSLFMYSREEGRELYGEECLKGAGHDHPEDVVRYMKRTVRQDPANLTSRIMSGGREYVLRDVIEKYLTNLVEMAKKGAVDFGEFTSTEIEEMTITAPVGIAQGQMMATDYNQLLMDTVGRITGLQKDRIHILQEPVAAAISYLYAEDMKSHYSAPQKVLVFDLGGGTLDVTVVRHDPFGQTYEILAKEGDLELGGNDWDAALGEAVKRKTCTGEFEDGEEEANFMAAVTKLKVDLTDNEQSMIFFAEDGEDRFCKFTRAEFDDVTDDLRERAIDVVNRALQGLDGGIDGIDRIVLVGGSSNMPQISERIREEFPSYADRVQVFEPSKAIAKGASVFAKLRSNKGGVGPGQVRDITSATYGFESCYHGKYQRIYNLIFKDTPYGDDNAVRARSETCFTPLEDSQTGVVFTIYESSSERGPEDDEDRNWKDFGNGEVQNGLEVSVQVPPEYLGRATGFSMWPELRVDSNGILEITIYDRAGNRLGYATNRRQ